MRSAVFLLRQSPQAAAAAAVAAHPLRLAAAGMLETKAEELASI